MTSSSTPFDSTISSVDDAHVVNPLSHLKVALVHDFFYTYGGAERVVEQIIRVFPQCDIFGLFDFLPDDQRGFLQGKPVTTSFLQKLPFVRKHHRSFLPLMPLAIEQLDVSSYDLVISSSYAVAKGVITGPDQTHVCYCHSPVRFAWDQHHQYLNEAGIGFGPIGMIKRAILHYVRSWDVRSAMGVDHFIANSEFVRRRIQKTYRRDAMVIHPPVDTAAFAPASNERQETGSEEHSQASTEPQSRNSQLATSHSDRATSHSPLATPYYVTASRLVSQKRIDLIVEAFTQMPDRELIVIGDGPERKRLESMAGDNVRFTGRLAESEMAHWFGHAKAFVFAAEEDFGIVPVEAMACGTPVIAYGRGGARETVDENESGQFFDSQTSPSLIEAVKRFEQRPFDSDTCVKKAKRFGVQRFRDELSELCRQVLSNRVNPKTSDSNQPHQTHPSAKASR